MYVKVRFFADPVGLPKAKFEKAQDINRAMLRQDIPPDTRCVYKGGIDDAHIYCTSSALEAVYNLMSTVPGAYARTVEVYQNGAINLLFRVPWLHHGERLAGFIQYRNSQEVLNYDL